MFENLYPISEINLNLLRFSPLSPAPFMDQLCRLCKYKTGRQLKNYKTNKLKPLLCPHYWTQKYNIHNFFFFWGGAHILAIFFPKCAQHFHAKEGLWYIYILRVHVYAILTSLYQLRSEFVWVLPDFHPVVKLSKILGRHRVCLSPRLNLLNSVLKLSLENL